MTGSRGATGEMVLVVTVALMLKCGAGRGRGEDNGIQHKPDWHLC